MPKPGDDADWLELPLEVREWIAKDLVPAQSIDIRNINREPLFPAQPPVDTAKEDS